MLLISMMLRRTLAKSNTILPFELSSTDALKRVAHGAAFVHSHFGIFLVGHILDYYCAHLV